MDKELQNKVMDYIKEVSSIDDIEIERLIKKLENVDENNYKDRLEELLHTLKMEKIDVTEHQRILKQEKPSLKKIIDSLKNFAALSITAVAIILLCLLFLFPILGIVTAICGVLHLAELVKYNYKEKNLKLRRENLINAIRKIEKEIGEIPTTSLSHDNTIANQCSNNMDNLEYEYTFERPMDQTKEYESPKLTRRLNESKNKG